MVYMVNSLKNVQLGWHMPYPLSLIYKLSYNTGIIPEEWKLGHVVPILKKGNNLISMKSQIIGLYL